MDQPPLPSGLLRPALAAVDPYEPGRPIEAVRLDTGIEEVVKLASNEGPFPPMPAAQQAIADAAAGLRMYPDPGCWSLRDALERRTLVPADRILPGNGVDSLIKLICLATVDPGDQVVMGWPSFISWRQATLMMGGEPVLVPLAANGAYDLDALLAAIGPRTKLVVIVSPNNPTGAAVSPADLESFLDRVPGHVLTVLDEAYFEYLPEGAHNGAELLRSGRPIAVTRTFSKIYGLAGLRVGYLMADTPLLGALARVRNIFDVGSLAQVAAVATLVEANAHLPERLALNVTERTRVDAALRDLGLAPSPSDANFLFVDLGTAERANAAFDGLIHQGIIVRPARGFGAPTAIRVTIGWPHENDRFLHTFAEVLATLPALAPS
jgi:histidinol-phosphate aminotransferase